ncbi:Phosphoadenylyl-sulfate reductase [thioredoxin] / Adenylyl-sulfate reductase [thioredoxin] [Richelia intracellularis]|nr:Phosphoadenylyl-sulfate reductase [thioredoxin] / Adenylyl-sulfate reductase [thioredoxin] [Richelia intracellularis]
MPMMHSTQPNYLRVSCHFINLQILSSLLTNLRNVGHKECCGIRKVKPLPRKLATVDASITGQRKYQNPANRVRVPVIQIDTPFCTSDRNSIKFNPLSKCTSAQVWQYIHANEVPYNYLHSKGFTTNASEPCTRAILPNQHEPLGRWWWEELLIKNVVSTKSI